MKRLTEGMWTAARYARSAWDLGIINILVIAPKFKLLDTAEFDSAEFELTDAEKIKIYYVEKYALRGVQIFVTEDTGSALRSWTEFFKYINYTANIYTIDGKETYDEKANRFLSQATDTETQKELAKELAGAFIGELVTRWKQGDFIDYTEKHGGRVVSNFVMDRAFWTPWKCGIAPRAHTLNWNDRRAIATPNRRYDGTTVRNTPTQILNGEAVRRED